MALLIVAVLLGIAGRTLIPYLEMLRDNPGTKFDRQFIVPPIISLVIGVLVSPLVFSALPPEAVANISLQGLAATFTAAWGLTDIVRSGQKVVVK